VGQTTVVKEKHHNSKLLTGVIIGGVLGGCLSLLDKNTRRTVTTKAVDMKDSSKNFLSHMKENPGEVKVQLLEQIKQATDTLKSTIQESKYLAERINSDVVEDAKEISHEAVSFIDDAKEDLKDIQSKVKDTSSKLSESSKKPQTQAELNANLHPY
jgi:gas vesicle protein